MLRFGLVQIDEVRGHGCYDTAQGVRSQANY